VEDLGVRIPGLEQPRHGVARPRGRVERGAPLAQPRVGGHRLGGGDRQQVAATLVQDESQVEERL
jgi:hypothetical protein